MPGHFTHIYTARRVADLLASGNFKDCPQRTDRLRENLTEIQEKPCFTNSKNTTSLFSHSLNARFVCA